MTREPNVYYATVGTSVQRNIASVWADRDADISTEPVALNDWLKAKLATDDGSFVEELAESDTQRTDGHRRLSAEISSLYAEGAPRPEPGDTVVLAASDSDAGRVSATAVGRVLSFWLGCPFYDQTETALEQGQQGVHAVTARGLQVDSVERFTEAVRDMAKFLALAYLAVPERGTLVVHPTGGFKATVPMLTNLSSHLPVDGHRNRNVAMWTNHERTRFGINLPIQRVPISEDLRADLKANDAHRRMQGDSPWRDYAWDGSGALTSIGEAILKMYRSFEPGR